MIALYIIAGIVLFILILHLVAPKDFKVSRSILINMPLEKVYNSLRSLKQQQEWSVWGKRDPEIKIEISGIDGEIASMQRWKGNKDVGEGEQELTKLIPMERIETELRFIKPWKITNTGFFDLKQQADGVMVTWGFWGKNKFPFSILMLFMNMDKAIGKDFEEGLSNFKVFIEKE